MRFSAFRDMQEGVRFFIFFSCREPVAIGSIGLPKVAVEINKCDGGTLLRNYRQRRVYIQSRRLGGRMLEKLETIEKGLIQTLMKAAAYRRTVRKKVSPVAPNRREFLFRASGFSILAGLAIMGRPLPAYASECENEFGESNNQICDSNNHCEWEIGDWEFCNTQLGVCGEGCETQGEEYCCRYYSCWSTVVRHFGRSVCYYPNLGCGLCTYMYSSSGLCGT
jgi:hypothetical protein